MEPSSICSNRDHDSLDRFIANIPSSLVPELLNNNKPPSATEAVIARTAIADISDDLQHLEEEGVRVQSVPDKLERYRDALQAYRYAHEGILSYIRKLPPETLGAIFLYSLPEHYDPSDDFNLNRPVLDGIGYHLYRAAVSKLGLVCKHWRDVSISTPQLWSRFSLDGLNHVNWVETWLQRSGEVPLQIHYTFRSIYPDMPPAPFPSSHAHRWQSADLELNRDFWEKISPSIDQLPLLRTLRLYITDLGRYTYWDEEQEEESDWTIEINTPSLRSLYLDSDSLGELPILQLSLSQLTHLSLRTDGDDPESENGRRRFLSMLRAAPNLVSISLVFDEDMVQLDFSWSDVPAESWIHLPHLRALCIRGEASLTLLRYLNTPALKKFRCSTWHFSQLLVIFASLVSRSRCRIETLEVVTENTGLETPTSASERLIQFLELTSDLITLEIKDVANTIITETVIDRLDRNLFGNLPHLVPGLKDFTMSVPKSLPLVKSFVDMIESRFEPNVSDRNHGTFEELEVVSLYQNESLDHSDTNLDESARIWHGERLMNLKSKGHRIVTQRQWSGGREPRMEEIFLAIEATEAPVSYHGHW